MNPVFIDGEVAQQPPRYYHGEDFDILAEDLTSVYMEDWTDETVEYTHYMGTKHLYYSEKYTIMGITCLIELSENIQRRKIHNLKEFKKLTLLSLEVIRSIPTRAIQ